MGSGERTGAMRTGSRSWAGTAGGGGGGAGGGRFGQAEPSIPTFGGTVPADPGEYTVVITAGGKTYTKTARILEDVWFDKAF